MERFVLRLSIYGEQTENRGKDFANLLEAMLAAHKLQDALLVSGFHHTKVVVQDREELS